MKPMLLRDYVGDHVNGWLMSEKMDGWRAIWDGKNFYSRELGLLDAPDWFKRGMPDVCLDGEIWGGRGTFNQIQGLMRDGWHGLEFVAFDLPMSDAPYGDRMASLSDLEHLLPHHASIAQQTPVAGYMDVVNAANDIVDAGGEGVVVRNPRGYYKAGQRSFDVLRLVPQDPAINRVIARRCLQTA